MLFRLLAALLLVSSVSWAGVEEAKAAYMRGLNFEKAKQYAQAVPEYEAALAAEPRYVYAHKQLGTCHYYLGNRNKALGHYEAYLKAMPNDAAIKRFADSLRAAGATPEIEGGSGGASDTQEAAPGPKKKKVRNNAIYTNPAAFAFATYNIGYTRAFGNHNSLIVEGAYASLGVGTVKYTLTGGGLGWHFTSRRLAGWFIGPKINYFVLEATATSSASVSGYGASATASATATATGSALGIGGEGGYQWVFGNGFFLNLGGGAQQLSMNISASASGTSSSGASVTTSTPTVAAFSGIIPSGMVNIGYAF